MHQKKTRIIHVLLFVMAAVLSVGANAQQQKPSERSFIVEMNKVKQDQAIRNEKIKQFSKPSLDSSSITPAKNNSQLANPASSTGATKINTGSTNNTTQNTQASAATSNQPAGVKPSQRPMKRPAYPTRRQ